MCEVNTIDCKTKEKKLSFKTDCTNDYFCSNSINNYINNNTNIKDSQLYHHYSNSYHYIESIINKGKFLSNFDLIEYNRFVFNSYSNSFYMTYLSNQNMIIKKTVQYNPNSNFNNYIKVSCICDGTLIFTELQIKKCAEIFLKNITKDKYIDKYNIAFYRNEDNPDSEYFFEIGNPIVISEYDKTKFATEEKSFLSEKITVFLPYRKVLIKD